MLTTSSIKRTADAKKMVISEKIGIKAASVDNLQDVFVMRPKMPLNCDGSYSEAQRLYDNGNKEARQLLMNECRLIYECKMCRNMFRSLTQFIGHKRVFCRSAANGDHDSAEDNNCNLFSNSRLMPAKDTCSRARRESVLKEGVKMQGPGINGESHEFTKSKMIIGDHIESRIEHEIPQNMVEHPVEYPLNTKELETNFFEDNTVRTSSTEQRLEQETNSTKCVLPRSCQARTLGDSIPSHLINCPAKHKIWSKTVTAGVNEIVTKRMKLQLSAESQDLATLDKSCNDFRGLDGSIGGEKSDYEQVSQETHPQPHATTSKKRRLKNGKTLSSNSIDDVNVASIVEGMQEVKQELCSVMPRVHHKTKSECTGGSETSDMELKKVISICSYCGKSFERRAALSTHLHQCPLKYDTLNMTVSAKRLKSNLTMENSSKDSRLQNMDSSVPEDPDTELLNEMFANLGRQTFGVGLRTVTLDQDDLTVSGADKAKVDFTEYEKGVNLANKSTKIGEDKGNNGNELKGNMGSGMTLTDRKEEQKDKKINRRIRSGQMEKRLLCRCKICYKQFNALSNLRRHISMFHYRAHRFGCTLCEYRAFRRYDIVNHLCNSHGMKGDPEMMSIEYVSEHELNYSREDVESDIVVLDEGKDITADNNVNKSLGNSNETKLNEKRLKRNRTITISSGFAAVISKSTRQKLKRSQSEHEASGNGMKIPLRRPIRNRIKPENKDFVYDLSSLLKKDNTVQNDVTRSLRRRNTMNGGALDSNIHYNESLLGPANHREHIRGAAQRLALSVINIGSAASATQPELPAERPQMRSRLISTHRADTPSVPVIEASELEAARLKSTLFDDTFLEKVAKAPATSFKIKPSLSLHTSTLNWLLQKVDSTLHQNSTINSSSSEVLCNDNGAIGTNIFPPQAIPRLNTPPPTPRKRITILDHLRDDTLKYRNSLLRSALEN